ncbi:hypothetical protein [Nitrospira sp. BLG_2]|uniref:hypothetical protein n=1 Tax=Nitrospira sp. BLG_2 TaxID=3397507 RepID=UPI003B9BFF81
MMTTKRHDTKDEFHQEMRKGWERVTTVPDGAIGWLVKFIQLDLEALTPSEWMVNAYEVASFAEAAGPEKHSLPVASASGWSVQALPEERLEYTLPSRKEAIQLQRTIRAHLEHLWQHGLAPVKFSDLTLIVTAPGALDDRSGSLLVSTKPKAKEFEYRVAVLLAHNAGRVRACEECQRIFVAARRDQLFCDPRCQMRVASRKWRKANKKKLNKEYR